MKKKIELPLIAPIYSTYNNQGSGSAILATNPSIQNWYYNEVLMLTCTLKFLNGYSSPEITVANSIWNENPYLKKQLLNTRFLNGYTNYVIHKLIDEGYYVYFTEFDDYYIKGKSWYQEKHFPHDGCICGYDDENKTYCIYAYDQNWIYQKFWTPQSSFEEGRKASARVGKIGYVCGIRPRLDDVPFSPDAALERIKEYLNPVLEPQIDKKGDKFVSGIIVHDYIADYIEKLYDGSIPYEKTDRRVLRMIWEHKKAMLERIRLIEKNLLLGDTTSKSYEDVVKEADSARMLYALHHLRRRDSVLPIIRKKILSIKSLEYNLLTHLLNHSKGADKS